MFDVLSDPHPGQQQWSVVIGFREMSEKVGVMTAIGGQELVQSQLNHCFCLSRIRTSGVPGRRQPLQFRQQKIAMDQPAISDGCGCPSGDIGDFQSCNDRFASSMEGLLVQFHRADAATKRFKWVRAIARGVPGSQQAINRSKQKIAAAK